ncbi:MAG: TonB-dependent receptor [Hyphomonadaceae bacterium]|nr:TonB-dependent receptor [Hyphomonadaceae bacterium]
MISNRFWGTSLAALIGAASLSTGVSWAQGAPAAAPQAGQSEQEAITVTGSRVITDNTRSPTPITSVRVEDITRTTPSDIPDALNKLPQIIGGRTPRTQGNASTNNGGNVLALRNFGVSRTLVLLNGHRVAPSNQDGSVNVDILPQSLMERVDIVTGGASAVYGSDAVSGVVNFVLDDDFTGFKYDVHTGISRYSDGEEKAISLAWGTDLFDGRGHFETAFRYRDQDQIPISARPYGENGQAWLLTGNGSVSNPFTNTPYARVIGQPMTGVVSCGSACPVNGYTFLSAGNLTPLTRGVPTGTGGIESGGDGGYVKFGTFRSGLEMADLFSRFDYDFSNDVHGYAQLSVAHSEVTSDWVNTVVSSSGSGRPKFITANNPYLSPASQALLGANIVCGTPAATGYICLPSSPPTAINRINPDGTVVPGVTPPAPPTVPVLSVPSYIWNRIGGEDAGSQGRVYKTIGDQANYAFETGLRGALGGFDWDVYVSASKSDLTVSNPNNTSNARYLASLDAVIAPPGTIINGTNVSGSIVCWVSTQPAFASRYPGCVPTNIVDPNGPSVASYEYLRQETHWTLVQEMQNFGASIGGGLWGFGLPAGEIRANLSVDARHQTYVMTTNASPTDFVDCTGLRFCLANGGAGGAPALWVQNTNNPVDANQDVYEAALEFNVPLLRDVPFFEDLSASAAGRHTKYSTFDAVESWKLGLDWHINSVFHFRGTQSVDIRAPNLNDLYQPAGISSTGFTDLLTGTVNNTQLQTSGNPNLTPEIARTVTLGLVFTPSFIENFNVSVDYYRTRMTDAITGIRYDTTAIQQLCLASAPTYTSNFCSLAVRPISNPSDPNYRTAANFPTKIFNSPLNAASSVIEGYELEANYSWSMDQVLPWLTGRFSARTLVSLQPTNTTINVPGTTPQWAFQPEYRQTTGVSYTDEDWGVALQHQYIGRARMAVSDNALNGNTQNYVIPYLPSMSVFGLTVSKSFEFMGGQNELFLNVSNLFDERAPLLPGNSGIPGLFYPTAAFEDDMGRFYTVGFRGKF